MSGRRRDGVVRFEPGGYASSPRTRPEFASNLYHEVAGLGRRPRRPPRGVTVRERFVEPTWAETMDTMRPAESVLVFRG
ncbi:hypothetical protein [Halomontanus rarus]|uniref:hypothetical protein n=1 Tax=Halomontanus rarus TaxID=3034020 RepID=UPI001A9A1F14